MWAAQVHYRALRLHKALRNALNPFISAGLLVLHAMKKLCLVKHCAVLSTVESCDVL